MPHSLPAPTADTPRAHTRPSAEPDWLFVRVHPKDAAGGLDPVVLRVVGRVLGAVDDVREGAATAGRHPDRRWFWLRYVDHAGPHLRLRVRARPAVVDELTVAVEEAAGDDTVTLGVYEPEHTAYGGAEGVARAERCFEHSSRLALQAVEELPWGRERLMVAAGLLSRAVDLLPPELRAAHLRSTEAYWRQGEPSSARGTGFDLRTADAWLDGPAAEHVSAWLEGVAAALEWPQAPTRSQWVFRHAHLMLNRLGVTPPVEAALAAGLVAPPHRREPAST